MLSDILPTGFEIGVRYGKVKPGDVVAVVGAGPVGLSAMMTAGLYGASRIIAARPRRQPARRRPRTSARPTRSTAATPTGVEQVMAMTDGLGVDVAIEAVGIPATFAGLHQAGPSRRPVANVGVHGEPVELALQDLWIADIAITMGLVSTSTTPMLLKLVAQHKLAAEKFATHHFTLDQMLEAYDTFGAAADTKALKVVIKR